MRSATYPFPTLHTEHILRDWSEGRRECEGGGRTSIKMECGSAAGWAGKDGWNNAKALVIKKRVIIIITQMLIKTTRRLAASAGVRNAKSIEVAKWALPKTRAEPSYRDDFWGFQQSIIGNYIWETLSLLSIKIFISFAPSSSLTSQYVGGIGGFLERRDASCYGQREQTGTITDLLHVIRSVQHFISARLNPINYETVRSSLDLCHGHEFWHQLACSVNL